MFLTRQMGYELILLHRYLHAHDIWMLCRFCEFANSIKTALFHLVIPSKKNGEK